ncbi:MAG TPA: hypothetical protein VNF68_05995 [Candidatus Baltobacteraceae bacterium]|nr:hypothetical protein [Candidatus Baltobacteraceae bacterium]
MSSTTEWQRAAADARLREGMDPIVDGYSTTSLDVDAVVRGISTIHAWWRAAMLER